MIHRTHVLLAVLVLASGLGACTNTGGGYADRRNQVIISVRDQRLTVVKTDSTRETFPISTSRFGLGDRPRSFATPLGKMEIAGKIGAGATEGTVFHGRVRTGEIVPENAPGRDPIVTRILRLRGLEIQNARAESRGIYIHGTPQENLIGEPVSFGCIRMRSRDVVRLFDLVGVGSPVMILDTPLSQAVAAVAPPRPLVPKPAVPTTDATPGEAPEAAAGAQPVAAAAQPGTQILGTKRDVSGTWAGDPSKLLGEPAPAPKKVPAPKKAVAKPKSKSKTQHYAQRSKTTRAKGSRSSEDTTSL
jgi:L,D-transpeptidase catalytic domain